jgi:thiamine-phosphate diphosphorylase
VASRWDSGLSERPPLPPLHLVTDDAVLARADFLAAAAEALAAGGERLALHLRGRATSGSRLAELALALRGLADARAARLLVNDRLDVALACGADGAQLPAAGVPPADARRLLGRGLWIGASAHTAGEVRGGVADFYLFGSVFATRSHPGAPPAGVRALSAMVQSADAPVVAIGGVTPRRVAGLREAGAAGVAVLGAVWNEPRPGQAVEALLRAGGWG